MTNGVLTKIATKLCLNIEQRRNSKGIICTLEISGIPPLISTYDNRKQLTQPRHNKILLLMNQLETDVLMRMQVQRSTRVA